METYSVLSQAAYTFNKNGGDTKATEKEIREYGIEGYKIDEELSDDESLVLFNDQGNEVTLAIRGTDPTSLKDLYADAQILVGRYGSTERFTGEFEKMNKILEKYPDSKHVVTGHSLGGNISYKIARKYGIESHNFNAGSSLREARDNLVSIIECGRSESDDCKNLEQQHFYTSLIDPISFMSFSPIVDRYGRQNVKYRYKPGVIEPVIGHSIKHFLPNRTGIVEKAYDNPIDYYNDMRDTGVVQMSIEPRMKVNQQPTLKPNLMTYEHLPKVRDYCRVNLLDPRCKISKML